MKQQRLAACFGALPYLYVRRKRKKRLEREKDDAEMGIQPPSGEEPPIIPPAESD